MRAILGTRSLSGILFIILMLICLLSSLGQVFGAESPKSKPKKLPKVACREYPREGGPSSFEQLDIKGHEKDEDGLEYLLVKYPDQGKEEAPKRLSKNTKGLRTGPCRSFSGRAAFGGWEAGTAPAIRSRKNP